jgi:hypothetical protein
LVTAELPKARGVVVVYTSRKHSHPRGHESVAHHELAKKLAAIKGYHYAGDFDQSYRYEGPLYFVPRDTITTIEFAHELGIHGKQDLFGGVVPFPFVATKTITHPLPTADSYAPEGWALSFARQTRHVVLPGFTAFTVKDAANAGLRLLKQGAVRIKKASGIGGLGQSVVTNADELEAELQSFDAAELLRDGVVLERNLKQVTTYSVGQVRLGKVLATYCGTQRLTINNYGQNVYGGSDLIIERGNFNALLQLRLAQEVRTAILQARVYHAAAMASFRGMFASRCNYDVAQGIDDQGQWRSGVLEQSWRIGGASGAEVAALDAFRADPALNTVHASTTEIYGPNITWPEDAVVYFHGIDDQVGPLTKYSRLEPYANSR